MKLNAKQTIGPLANQANDVYVYEISNLLHIRQALPATILHWPNGQACATCMFAGNTLYELNTAEMLSLRKCVTESTERGLDPWQHCVPATEKIKMDLARSDFTTLRLY